MTYWKLAAGLTAASLATHAPSHAETAAEEQPDQERAIVVTGQRPQGETGATRTAEPLINIPQSITVVTEDEIRDQLLLTQTELLRNVPSVGRSQNQGNVGGSQNTTIRGFNTRTVYKDGARFGTIGEIYLDNIASVEILRGPAGMLYGVTPPGGVIVYTRRRPQAEWAASADFTVGSDNFLNPRINLTGPLTEGGALSFRVIGALYRDGVFVDRADREAEFISPSLRLALGNFTADLVYEYGHAEETFIYGLPLDLMEPAQTLPRERFLGHPDNIKITTDEAVSLNLAYQAGPETTLRALAHQTRFVHESYSVRPGAYNIAARTYTPSGSLRPATPTVERALELNLDHGFTLAGMEATLLAGVDYRRARSENQPCNGNRPGLYTASVDAPDYTRVNPRSFTCATPGFVFFDVTTSTQEERGGFAQGNLWLTDKLQLLAGLRYSEISQETQNFTRNTTTEQRDDAVTARAGLVYKPRPNLSFYASYAESFQQLIGVAADGSSFKPTRGVQYELGSRLNLFGGAATLSGSLFQITQSNLTIADTANPGFSIQLGEVESRGAELELAGRFGPRLELIGGFSYLDNTIVGGPNDGNRLPNVYRTKASLFANYTLADSERLRWTLGAGAFYHGNSFLNEQNNRAVPAATLFDAMTALTIPAAAGELTLQLNVKNIFDRLDYTGGFGSGPGVTVYPEARRQVFLRASVGF
jgi:iron complex outermembrane recepter protein